MHEVSRVVSDIIKPQSRATSNKALERIYKEIDKLERSKIEVKEYHKKKEEFFIVALIAFCLLILEFLLEMELLYHLKSLMLEKREALD
ncbi:hypothetical protein N9Y89_00090 [bacterium]|nr:hypothetical protein [bacterium]